MKRFASLLLFFLSWRLSAATYPAVGGITRLDPALDSLIAPGTAIEKLCDGLIWAEGPVWKDGAVYFSDVAANTIYCWKPGQTKAERFLSPSGVVQMRPGLEDKGANGLTLDPQGRLVLCQHGERRVVRLNADRSQTVVADRFEGKRFNSPNDLAFRRNGDLYFTDPPYGLDDLDGSKLKELKFNGVFQCEADGRVALATSEMKFPNGLAFSPDEKILYVGSTAPGDPYLAAFEVHPDGSLGPQRRFFDARPLMTSPDDILCDGLKVDRLGNIFTTGPKGLLVSSLRKASTWEPSLQAR